MGRSDTSLSLQLVQCNWQIANAFSGCVVDRVRNCRRNADGADFAQPLDSKRIDELVRLVDEDHLDILHVRIRRYVLFAVGIHDAAEPVVKQRFGQSSAGRTTLSS